MFERIRDFYRRKLYTKAHIDAFIIARVITPEQYKEITGEDYVA